MSTNRPIDNIITNVQDVISEISDAGDEYAVATELAHQLLEELQLIADEDQ